MTETAIQSMKETLTQDTVIKTNIATMLSILVGVAIVVGAWTTAMINISANRSLIETNTSTIQILDSRLDENRELLLSIDGDVKEVRALIERLER